MVTFESLEIGAKFTFDGNVLTKMTDLMARDDNPDGLWWGDAPLFNPFAESKMVVPVWS